MQIASFLVFLGFVILIGVFSNYFFSKTRIPTPVVLILCGIIFGPLTGIIQAGQFQFMAPYFGSIALILILFEGGLELDPKSALHQAKDASYLAILSFILTATIAYFTAKEILNLDHHPALFYGLVLGGVSPAIIFPIIQSLNIEKDLKALFALESVISEVLTVALTVIAMDLYDQKNSHSGLWSQVLFLLHLIFMSLLVAIAFGWAWNWLMPKIERAGLSHMLTLSCLFLLYAVSTWVHAEPAITILLFGLLIENGHNFSLYLKKWLPEKLVHLIDFPSVVDKKTFSTVFSELTFLVRSFFFVLVGLIINFTDLTNSIITSALVFCLMTYLSRQLVVQLVYKFSKKLPLLAKNIAGALIPRGLATAVVALMVAGKIPGTENLPTMAFIIILISNLIMTAQVLYRWKAITS